MSDKMTVIFYRYDSICEEDYIDAFKVLGMEVYEITAEMKDKDLPASKRVELVHNAIEAHTPLFVFSINFFPAVADICFIHKVLYLCQTVDSPMVTLFSPSVKHSTNRIFLFDRAQFERFSCYNPGNIYHLPLASAVKRYDAVISGISEEDRQRFNGDIAFVGSLYSEKNPLNGVELSDYTRGFINGISDMQGLIYGSNLLERSLSDRCVKELKEKLPKYFAFDDPVEPTDAYIAANSVIGMELAQKERIKTLNLLAEHFDTILYTRSDTSALRGVTVRGGVKTHTEMPKIFNISKINLNITIRPIESGLPLRIFDIMGSGGFVLTNYQAEITDLFEPGKELEVYTDYEELVLKCRYYLEHEEERKRIAENGHRKVAEYYTYELRVMEMLKLILS
ncbi:MAG: glycosyltransferase [Lachnospiraceae bacterium]|nr:glycosyltransferase [Lachnospiraceae bacterium]